MRRAAARATGCGGRWPSAAAIPGRSSSRCTSSPCSTAWGCSPASPTPPPRTSGAVGCISPPPPVSPTRRSATWWTPCGTSRPQRVEARGRVRREIRSVQSPAVLVAVAAVIAVATIGRAHIGADFFDYLEWTKAFLTADVTQISSAVVSPEGYPLTQYHPGTGALFALPKLVAPGRPGPVQASLAAGAATLVLWTCIAALIARAAGGRADIVLLGIPLLFIATHAGYQSTAIASELLSLALMAVLLVTMNLGSEETAPFSILVFGCAAGLLIGVRANLAPYVAAGALVYFRRILRAPVTRARKGYLVVLVIVPVAAGCAPGLAGRHWVAGSWAGSTLFFR